MFYILFYKGFFAFFYDIFLVIFFFSKIKTICQTGFLTHTINKERQYYLAVFYMYFFPSIFCCCCCNCLTLSGCWPQYVAKKIGNKIKTKKFALYVWVFEIELIFVGIFHRQIRLILFNASMCFFFCFLYLSIFFSFFLFSYPDFMLFNKT